MQAYNDTTTANDDESKMYLTMVYWNASCKQIPDYKGHQSPTEMEESIHFLSSPDCLSQQ